MAVESKTTFYINESGGVNRSVEKRLDKKVTALVSDFEVAEDAQAFMRENPDVTVQDRDAGAATVLPDSSDVPVEDLDDFLESYDDIEDVVQMRDADPRPEAESRYTARAQELFMETVGVDPMDVGDALDDEPAEPPLTEGEGGEGGGPEVNEDDS